MYVLKENEYWSSSGPEYSAGTDDDSDEQSILSKQKKSTVVESSTLAEHTDKLQKTTLDTTFDGNTAHTDTMMIDVQDTGKTHVAASAESSRC